MGYAAEVPIVTSNVDAANNQFHAQDDLGQYNYGFAHPTQTKQEVKTADGVTRGGYSYIDANGIVQTVNYISDAMGFRVAATNLPVHHVDAAAPVAVEPAAPAAAPVVSAAVSAYHAGDVIAPQVQYSYLPYAQNYAYHTAAAPVVKAAPSRPVVSVTHTAPTPAVHAAPVVQVAAPVAYAAAPVQVAPAAVQGSQYHAQDDAGQYSFGYNDGSSVKQEIRLPMVSFVEHTAMLTQMALSRMSTTSLMPLASVSVQPTSPFTMLMLQSKLLFLFRLLQQHLLLLLLLL